MHTELVTIVGVPHDTQRNQPEPSAQVEVDVKHLPAYSSVFMPGSYAERHFRFRHNGVPKLVQVYADGVLLGERRFWCGYRR